MSAFSLKNGRNSAIKKGLIFACAAIIAAGAVFAALGGRTEKAFANSAQRYYKGIDSGGVAVKHKEGLVSVKSETLTFDISSETLKNYNYGTNSAGTVTASYELFNEGETAAKVGLLFPLGQSGYEERPLDEDASLFTGEEGQSGYEGKKTSDAYAVKRNGEDVEKNIRHSFKWSGEDFDLEKDSKRLYDGYKEDDFYSPELKVYKREYSVAGTDLENAVFGCSVSKSAERGIMADISRYESSYGETRFYGRVKENKFTIYFLGEDKADFHLKINIYKSFDIEHEKPTGALVTPISVEETAFGEMVEQSRNSAKAAEVTKEDWYNAVISYLYASGKNLTEPYFDAVAHNLLRWYEYELDFAAGETVTNEVTAPLYPSVDAWYSPNKYTFVYLLSPAKTWKSFKNLTVKINTDMYLTEGHLSFAGQSLTKNDSGYEAKFEVLPESELVFTLCASENPERVGGKAWKTFGIAFGIIFVIAVLAVLAVPVTGLVLLCTYHKNLKKKNAEIAAKEKAVDSENGGKAEFGGENPSEKTEKESDKEN